MLRSAQAVADNQGHLGRVDVVEPPAVAGLEGVDKLTDAQRAIVQGLIDELTK